MPKRRRRVRPTTAKNRTLRTGLLKRIRLLRLKQRIRHTGKRADEIAGLVERLDAISPYPATVAPVSGKPLGWAGVLASLEEPGDA
jgi:hypothetical protein